MHVNVNCSNLERSLRFYQDTVGLKSESHTNPVPQDGAGFGMSGQVQWDAHILHDARGFAGPGIDLLQWMQPKPVGQPHPSCRHRGFSRIGIGVPDLDAAYEKVVGAGAACLSPPVEERVDSRDDVAARVFRCTDPDGTFVEMVERKQLSQPQLAHVVINCSDLARSGDWYEAVLGMQVKGQSSSGEISGQGVGLSEKAEWSGRSLQPSGVDGFAIELVEWKRPRPVGVPYPSANHLGIYRMAFMVEDMQSCYAEIVSQGVECSPPVYLDMGPEIPIDGLWALFFPDPNGTCMELIETPKLNDLGS
jgi:catechol 2,3-dioxygenase-like lactoylglutathione lyase family enzyme